MGTAQQCDNFADKMKVKTQCDNSPDVIRKYETVDNDRSASRVTNVIMPRKTLSL